VSLSPVPVSHWFERIYHLRKRVSSSLSPLPPPEVCSLFESADDRPIHSAGTIQFPRTDFRERRANRTLYASPLILLRSDINGPPQESTEGDIPEKSWPSKGEIQVEGFSVRYGIDLPDVLHEVSFDVEVSTYAGYG
jgi:hypothetical protein